VVQPRNKVNNSAYKIKHSIAKSLKQPTNLHNFWRTSTLCWSEHVCSCHCHSGATWWKTTTCFPLLKQKAAFLGLLTSWLQSKHYEKSTVQTSFLHVNVCLMCPLFWWKCIWDYITIHWWWTPARLSTTPRCTSSLQPAQSWLLFWQTVYGLFQHIAIVDFIQQPGNTGSAQHLMLKFP